MTVGQAPTGYYSASECTRQTRGWLTIASVGYWARVLHAEHAAWESTDNAAAAAPCLALFLATCIHSTSAGRPPAQRSDPAAAAAAAVVRFLHLHVSSATISQKLRRSSNRITALIVVSPWWWWWWWWCVLCG